MTDDTLPRAARAARARPVRSLLLTAAGLAATVIASATHLPAHAGEAAASLPTARDDLTEADLERVRSVTAPTTDFSKPEPFEALPGGAATARQLVNRNAFSHPSANLTFEEEETFKIGNGFFTKNWVSSPSSTFASDGLGPLFNARSCQGCHLKDGRGHPPEAGEDATSMFLRLARAPSAPLDEGDRAKLAAFLKDPRPDPTYGRQLQDFAVPGLKGEGRMRITYTDMPVTLADGTTVTLRKPSYGVDDLAYGPMAKDVTLSPRVAQPMIGLGLVEAIAPTDILAHADPDDRDGDGISGRAGLAVDPKSGGIVLARFGWKASTATIRQQTADAFSGDMGISSPDAPDAYGDCTFGQSTCRAIPTGVQAAQGDTEAPDPVLDLVSFYARNLAVPARRSIDDPEVLAGKAAFYRSGCPACHTPKFVTSRNALGKAQAFQLIWPYSDFLLHDMGDGLADGQAVGVASGREWRTPPLWGIGLTRTVSDHTFFLHDGRARDLTEAILWHGGEAKAARDRFAALGERDRAALIKFLESL